ncbi:MAG: hypothetical protein U5Q44_02470 [Dehalococcoidia bacterium]|nr:hypothetical protein [Dehalococcoidia bacterium]
MAIRDRLNQALNELHEDEDGAGIYIGGGVLLVIVIILLLILLL